MPIKLNPEINKPLYDGLDKNFKPAEILDLQRIHNPLEEKPTDKPREEQVEFSLPMEIIKKLDEKMTKLYHQLDGKFTEYDVLITKYMKAVKKIDTPEEIKSDLENQLKVLEAQIKALETEMEKEDPVVNKEIQKQFKLEERHWHIFHNPEPGASYFYDENEERKHRN